MSTRAVIAIPDGDGFKGRYVHNDGNPRHLGYELGMLVSDHGLESVIKTLITDSPIGWSIVARGMLALPSGGWSVNSGNFALIEGWGVAYTRNDASELAAEDDWYDMAYCSSADSDIDWVYVLNVHGFLAMSHSYGVPGLISKGQFNWTDVIGKLAEMEAA